MTEAESIRSGRSAPYDPVRPFGPVRSGSNGAPHRHRRLPDPPAALRGARDGRRPGLSVLAVRGRSWPARRSRAFRRYQDELRRRSAVSHDPAGDAHCEDGRHRRRSIGAARSKDSLRLRWIHARACENGFRLLSEPEMRVERVRLEEAKVPFAFNACIYRAPIRVTGSAKFTRAYTRGLGQGRAWGCGMIVLRKS